MPYLFAAFCAIWLVLFLYVLSVSRRQRVIAHEIEALRQMMERKNAAKPARG